MLSFIRKLAVPALTVGLCFSASPAIAAPAPTTSATSSSTEAAVSAAARPMFPISKHKTSIECSLAAAAWHESHPAKNVYTLCSGIKSGSFKGWYQLSATN